MLFETKPKLLVDLVAREDELCSVPFPLLFHQSCPCLSRMCFYFLKLGITKSVCVGEMASPYFVFVPDGDKKLTFTLSLWDWISDILCFKNNTSKIHLLDCVCGCVDAYISIAA